MPFSINSRELAAFPLSLLSSTDEAEIVRRLPTFFAIGWQQEQYQRYCAGVDLTSISKEDQEACFQQWCTNSDFQTEINLAVGYDLLGEKEAKNIRTDQVLALQASIANNKIDGNGCVYLPLRVSAMDIFMMRTFGVFSIPAFFEAYLTPLQLGESGCPVQVCAEVPDGVGAGINVLVKISLNEHSCMRELTSKEEGIKKVLVSCGSYFECQFNEEGQWWEREEDGPVVLSLETTSPQDSTLPVGNISFISWQGKRGATARSKDMLPSDFGHLLKRLEATFARNFPQHAPSRSNPRSDDAKV